MGFVGIFRRAYHFLYRKPGTSQSTQVTSTERQKRIFRSDPSL
jgi:hypothetical protein